MEPGSAGFDCMSLAQYAVYQVTGIVLPSDGSQLSGVGTVIPASDTADLQPGDVTFWGGHARPLHPLGGLRRER